MNPSARITKPKNNSQLRREKYDRRQKKESLERERQEDNRYKFQPIKKRHRWTTDKLGANVIKKLVPAYDPSKNEFDSRTWTEFVDNIRIEYDWSDRDTIFYASFRMEKAARTWFLRHGAELRRWSEFQGKLIEAFPQRLPKKIKSPKKIQWSSTKTPEKAVDEEPVQKLSRTSEVLTHEITKKLKVKLEIKSEEEKNPMKLHQKSSKSDDYKKAKKNKRQSEICYHCKEFGHIAKYCENADKEVFYEMRYVRSRSENPKLLVKHVNVNNVSMQAFLDLSSDTSIIKSSETFAHNWKPLPCNVKLIGIGGKISSTLGRLIKTVNVDGVIVKNIEIFAVPDNFMDQPMHLGRNFWATPNVCVIKKFNSLKVVYANDMVG